MKNKRLLSHIQEDLMADLLLGRNVGVDMKKYDSVGIDVTDLMKSGFITTSPDYEINTLMGRGSNIHCIELTNSGKAFARELTA